MEPSRIINFKELSAALGLDDGSIRRNKIPKKYEQLVLHITRSIDFILEDFKKHRKK